MTIIKHNPEAELGVIGALITNGDYHSHDIQKAMLRLQDSFFYDPCRRELFKVIKKCFEAKRYFDFPALSDVIKDKDIYECMINAMSGSYFTATRVESEITELERALELRNQLKVMIETYNQCQEEGLIQVASDILFDGIDRMGKIKLKSMQDGSTYEQIAESYLNGEFKDSDAVRIDINSFGEIRNSSLITIAGASGVGKTYFGVYLMEVISTHQPNKQTLFFSLEMARNEIWERHLSILSGKDFDGDISAISLGMNSEHKVYDEPRIDIDYIETVCNIEAMRKPISVIVVDYIGLVTSKQKYDREDLRIADITQRLTALAMKLKCIVIGLTQTNRDASKRTKDDRCPYPSDVADSVGSVRSSSLWIGIDRPELYDDDPTKKNVFVAKCRKNRRGDNFEAYFDFNGGKFVERNKPFWNNEQPESLRDKFKNTYQKGK